MTSALIVFCCAFGTVFLLGLQSQNVNQGHYKASIICSFGISTGSIFLYKYMAVSTVHDIVGFYLGAAGGISFSIYFHKRVKHWWIRWTGERRLRRAIALREKDSPPRPTPSRPRCHDEHAQLHLNDTH